MKKNNIIRFFGLIRSEQKSKTVITLKEFLRLKEAFRKNCKRRRCRRAGNIVRILNQKISHFDFLDDYPILKEFETRIYEKDLSLLNDYNIALDKIEKYLEEYSKIHD